MTPQAQQQLVNALNAGEHIFDIDQFRGYMVSIALAPSPIPASEWGPILLGALSSDSIESVAEQLQTFYQDLVGKLRQGKYRLPNLGAVDTQLSIYDGKPHKLRQWAAGFQAGATDFVTHWHSGDDQSAVQECLMVLSCLAFEESARYFAEELDLEIGEFVAHNRSRMQKSIKYLSSREQQERTVAKPNSEKDGRVDVLLTTADPKQQVAIAEAILSDNAQCAEAWDVLARLKSNTVEQVQQCLEHAVSAAEQQLGKDYLDYYQGKLWHQEEARILLQVLVGLGACFKKQKRYERSAACYEKALMLDSEDHVGAQAALLTIYFLLGRYDAVGNILAYYDVANAWSDYSKVLLSYVRAGDNEVSRHLRDVARRNNKHVAKYLAGRAKLPDQVGVDYQVGSKDEAAIYAEDARDAWRKVIGSIAWLLG